MPGLAVLSALATACPQRAVGLLEPGSSVHHLAFGIGTERQGHAIGDLAILEVATCASSTGDMTGVRWSVEPTGGGGVPQQVSYGMAPPGYTVKRQPASLTPGCYRVAIDGQNVTRFRVTEAGTVEEVSR